MMQASLTDLPRGGVPALAVLGIVVVVVARCHPPALRRRFFAPSLIPLAARAALFRMLAPAEAPCLDRYLRFLTLFTPSDPVGRG